MGTGVKIGPEFGSGFWLHGRPIDQSSISSPLRAAGVSCYVRAELWWDGDVLPRAAGWGSSKPGTSQESRGFP
jgi:hypothetical protein